MPFSLRGWRNVPWAHDDSAERAWESKRTESSHFMVTGVLSQPKGAKNEGINKQTQSLPEREGVSLPGTAKARRKERRKERERAKKISDRKQKQQPGRVEPASDYLCGGVATPIEQAWPLPRRAGACQVCIIQHEKGKSVSRRGRIGHTATKGAIAGWGSHPADVWCLESCL